MIFSRVVFDQVGKEACFQITRAVEVEEVGEFQFEASDFGVSLLPVAQRHPFYFCTAVVEVNVVVEGGVVVGGFQGAVFPFEFIGQLPGFRGFFFQVGIAAFVGKDGKVAVGGKQLVDFGCALRAAVADADAPGIKGFPRQCGLIAVEAVAVLFVLKRTAVVTHRFEAVEVWGMADTAYPAADFGFPVAVVEFFQGEDVVGL